MGQGQPEFDQYADDYDAALNRGLAISGEGKDFFARGRLEFLKRCLRDLNVAPAEIMDFGCGTGTSVPLITELFPSAGIVGVDESGRSIERASRTYAASAVRFTTTERYVPSGAVDLVYTNGVFHHIAPSARPRSLAFLREVLRPGGILSLWENNPWSLGARYVMSKIPFDRDAVMLSAREARHLLEAQGFRVLRTDYLFVFPAKLRVLRGLEERLRRVPLGAQYQVLCARA